MNRFIPLDHNGNIRQKESIFNRYRNISVTIPTGVVSQPAEHTFLDGTVKNVTEYVFYCNSVPKEDARAEDIVRTGSGSIDDPFIDLNYALECLCCEAQKVCDKCFAFVLKVSGTVNYRIFDHDGNGVVFIDATLAEVTVDFSEQYVAYELVSYCRGITICFGNLDASIDGGSIFTGRLFAECVNCRIVFDKINVTVISNSTDGHYSVFDALENCTICGNSIIVYAMPLNEYRSSYYSAAYECKYCTIAISSLHIEAVQPLFVYGYFYCNECTFIDCHVTFAYNSMLEDGRRAGCGCGFSDNESATWIGENIGYHYTIPYVGEIIIDPNTLNANCEGCNYTSAPEPSASESYSSSITPPPQTGIVKCHHFQRKLQFRLYALPYKYHDTDCKADVYVTSINVSKGRLCSYLGNPYTTEFTSYHGKLITLDGELEEWEDENGEIVRDCNVWTDVYCDPEGFFDSNDETDTRLPDVTADAITSGTRDINALINGELYVMPEHDDAPIAEDNSWKGFNQYQRCGSLGYIYPKTLTDADRTLTVNTITGVDYYSIYGEYPCMNGDGYGNVTIDTYVFEWQSSDDSDEQPDKLVLEDASGNTIHCKFGQEYCLHGNEDVDRDMLSLVTCDDLVDPVCKYVVLKGTTSKYDVTQDGITLSNSGSSNYPKPTRTVTRTYTYKGVIF